MPAHTHAYDIYLCHQCPIRHLRSFINVNQEPFVTLNASNFEAIPPAIQFLPSWKCAWVDGRALLWDDQGDCKQGRREITSGHLETSCRQCSTALGCDKTNKANRSGLGTAIRDGVIGSLLWDDRNRKQSIVPTGLTVCRPQDEIYFFLTVAMLTSLLVTSV